MYLMSDCNGYLHFLHAQVRSKLPSASCLRQRTRLMRTRIRPSTSRLTMFSTSGSRLTEVFATSPRRGTSPTRVPPLTIGRTGCRCAVPARSSLGCSLDDCKHCAIPAPGPRLLILKMRLVSSGSPAGRGSAQACVDGPHPIDFVHASARDPRTRRSEPHLARKARRGRARATRCQLRRSGEARRDRRLTHWRR